MSDADFPALGFDPARGDVGRVREIATELSGTGRYAGEAYDVLRSIQDKRDVWTGDAATAFVEKLGELPGFLEGARDSMTSAGSALSIWADRLEAHQRRARELEERARKAIAAAEQADVAARQASAVANRPIAYDANDPAAAQAAERRAQANATAAADANRAAGAAWANVEDLRREAENLRHRWEDDARICAEALNEAAGGAPDSGLFDDIGDFVNDAGEWLAENLGDIAGIVSAIAGVLAFIPVLTPIMAPIALGTGALALAAHGTEMIVEGKWDDPMAWAELGGDLVGLVPGLGAATDGVATAMRVASGAEKTIDVTRVGLSGMAETASEAIYTGAKVFGDDMAKPSMAAQWVAQKAMGANPLIDTAEMSAMTANVAKALEGGANVSLQIPQGIALADSGPEATAAKDATTVAGGVLGTISGISDHVLKGKMIP
ncbi:hypothetical protein SAMN05421810_103365 [Amycolatopsis arida]|uniref:Proteins of 100 residues with WXG n=1 Tax=Amycolatopsis arida TaxID=587909 RepID=A0A1I5T2W6_9PSEU|nr:hypothetical protein [Amycolatopsis arida]TDX96256.1 hypothetical protein CLV69_103393 [Amycolatopsis arida]SFP77181.1 hypothetical protein SAMN05421810_103365 [Amycolatopsis arida]